MRFLYGGCELFHMSTFQYKFKHKTQIHFLLVLSTCYLIEVLGVGVGLKLE